MTSPYLTQGGSRNWIALPMSLCAFYSIPFTNCVVPRGFLYTCTDPQAADPACSRLAMRHVQAYFCTSIEDASENLLTSRCIRGHFDRLTIFPKSLSITAALNSRFAINTSIWTKYSSIHVAVRRAGILNGQFTILSVSVKQFWNFWYIWWSYDKTYSGILFWTNDSAVTLWTCTVTYMPMSRRSNRIGLWVLQVCLETLPDDSNVWTYIVTDMRPVINTLSIGHRLQNTLN